jgi:arylsulfatase A-like enzyme
VLLASLVALEPVGSGVPAVANEGAERPNVLIILTDDQRADMMEVLRRTRAWFETGGTTFPNAFATTPLCCPSRASIMTGQYAHNTNVETNLDAERLDQRSTMQRYLQDAGYRTAIVGKYLNSWPFDPPFFHDFAVFRAREGGYKNAFFNINGAHRRVKRYSTDYIGARSVQLLRSFEADDRKPWFLYVAPFAPHAPYEPAKKFRRTRVPKFRRNPAMRESDRTDKPQWVQEKGPKRTKGRKVWTLQERMLLSVDRLVNRILTTLDELNERGPTMVFFLSDNGFTLGEHGLQQKHSPYTQSVQIPFAMRWPGHVASGEADPRLVATIDIAPTIYDAAGITPDEEYPVDGRSLLGPDERDRILLEYHHREDRAVPTWSSTRTQTYQYTEYYSEDLQEVIFREYYDLSSDPWQLTNLLSDADTTNDPDPGDLTLYSIRVRRDRRCEGTEGPEACP